VDSWHGGAGVECAVRFARGQARAARVSLVRIEVADPMGSFTKVLPIATDEVTSLDIMGDADVEEFHDSEKVPVALDPLDAAASAEETTVKVLQGRVGDASELPMNTDAPLFVSKETYERTNSQSIQPPPRRPPPPVIRSASSSAKRAGIVEKRRATLQVLTGVSKADLKAKQKADIERKAQPPRTHSLHDRAVYKVDKYISTRKGQTISLAGLGMVFMVIGACILKASQPSQYFHEMVWQSWTFLGDSGSHTSLTESGLRVIGVIMTLTGILYFSVIMGFVVDGIRDKMDSLKKGKSKVVEANHTVRCLPIMTLAWGTSHFLTCEHADHLQLMLGWTDKSISLIRQLCLANASEKGGVVVVLAEREKEELEAELVSQLSPHEMLGTNVIFRTGSPMLSVDLLKVAAHRARSIIIMAQTSGDADRSDATVLRTVLGLKTLPEVRSLGSPRVCVSPPNITRSHIGNLYFLSLLVISSPSYVILITNRSCGSLVEKTSKSWCHTM
jgi:hypothetical protein